MCDGQPVGEIDVLRRTLKKRKTTTDHLPLKLSPATMSDQRHGTGWEKKKLRGLPLILTEEGYHKLSYLFFFLSVSGKMRYACHVASSLLLDYSYICNLHDATLLYHFQLIIKYTL